ncbi:MAG TPA: PQQ-binding-like beta-propeller repeat protein [Actinomycetota bacterium]|nr:PQQ-binding-like beta-propeller repeat protein [Actinomycetota bacterium]
MRLRVITATTLLLLTSLPGVAGAGRAWAADDSRGETWTERWDSGLDEAGLGVYPAEDVRDSAISPDGRYIYVTGVLSKGNRGQADAFTLAYEAATGKPIWQHLYGGTIPDSGNGAYAIAISPDGERLFVTGFADGSFPGDPGLGVISYDAKDGDVLWAESVAGTYSVGSDVVVADDGDEVYVTGAHYPDGGGLPDVVLAGFDTKDGENLWHETYDGNDGFDRGWQIQINKGRLFVLAQVQRGPRGTNDVHVLAYDTADRRPKLAWDSTSVLDGSVDPEQMDVSPNGSVFVTAPQHENDDGLPKMSRVVRLDRNTGEVKWSVVDRRIVSDTLTVDSEESAIYVTGGDSPLDNRNHPPAALAFDARTGEARWQAKIPATYETIFTDAGLDERRGTFYATGNALADGWTDMFTVALDTTSGELDWVARFNPQSGHGISSGATLSVGPDGSVFSAGLGSGTDTPAGSTPTWNWTNVFIVAYRAGKAVAEISPEPEDDTPDPQATDEPQPEATVTPTPVPQETESPQPEASPSPEPELSSPEPEPSPSSRPPVHR